MRLPAATLAAAIGALIPSPASPQALGIDHPAVECVVARRFPALSARIDPADQVARARIYFRAAGRPHWYYVDMKPEVGVFRGTLPRPRKGTTAIEYYIEAVDTASATTRTPDYAPSVVGTAAECNQVVAAASATSAPSVVAVHAPPGAPFVPAGFEASGIAAAGAAGAAAAATAVAAGAGGGGLGTTALVVGGVVVAGGAAAAATLGGGSDGDGDGDGGDGDGNGDGQCGTVRVTDRTATTLTVTWSGGQPTDGVYVVDAAVPPPGAQCPVLHEGRQYIVRTTSVVITGLVPATTYAVHVHPAGARCPNCDTGYEITDSVGVAIATTLGQ